MAPMHHSRVFRGAILCLVVFAKSATLVDADKFWKIGDRIILDHQSGTRKTVTIQDKFKSGGNELVVCELDGTRTTFRRESLLTPGEPVEEWVEFGVTGRDILKWRATFK